jgi:beta-aspartyl-peptidase (threonine type)
MNRAIRFLPIFLLCLACAPAPPGGEAAEVARMDWALAIHGGAGVPLGSLTETEQEAYLESLERALSAGAETLEAGGSSLDAVEAVIRLLEEDELFNAGRGAVFTSDGRNELDASIMDGATLDGGAVTGVTTVKSPIGLARLVMEQTDHVLLAGEGAESFAGTQGVERVDPGYFFTQKRWDTLQRVLGAEESQGGGTVGAVALDRAGNLAAGTSTGGLTGKLPGRVGDTPILGAGTYADNRSCAVSCTGHGEEFIRRSVAFRVATLVRETGLSVGEAARKVVQDELRQGDGGLIAVGADGDVAMVFNTPGMFRGAADSAGRFELGIWD